jgi:hypothetical protein
MNKGEIVTLVTPMGEVVGRLVFSLPMPTTSNVTLDSPRLFVNGQDGQGFAPGICMTGEREPAQLNFNTAMVLSVAKTDKDVAKGWTEATSSIVLS